jgi:UDP-N-acetylmuramoylalanine--D-glutamate ligase
MQNIQRAAVFGMGKSGVAAATLLQSLGVETHVVNEGEPEVWGKPLEGKIAKSFWHKQQEGSEIFGQVDLIVISPGIPATHDELKLAVQKKIRIISEIELAFWFCQKTPVIAITGTNGKTTTTTMIYEALKLAGKKVFCGGNIGTPYCEMAMAVLRGESFDYAVIEVSSFQLETIETFHPHIALMLNLTLNHSERYTGLVDYGQAKLRILKNATASDHLIVGEESGVWVKWSEAYPSKRHLFSKARLPADFLARFDFSKGVLVGAHNRANYFCAWKTLSLLNILQLDQLFQKFIETFPGVEHRLEFVGNFSGLKVYNDAKSTNGEATRTALAAFEGDEPLYLVVGGKLRNETDKLLPELLGFKNRITKIFTIGMTTERLVRELSGEFKVEAAYDLSGLFTKVREQKLSGSLVFSPAHPSFDQFKNYGDRGLQFKAMAREILA